MPEADVHTGTNPDGPGGLRQEMNGSYLNDNVVPLKGEPQGVGTKKEPLAASKEVAEKRAGQLSAHNLTPQSSLHRAQDVLERGQAALIHFARQLGNLSPDLGQIADRVAYLEQSNERLKLDLEAARTEERSASSQVKRSQLELVQATTLFEAEITRVQKLLENGEENLRHLRLENAMNEFRSRHRKRERDYYRGAFHQARYFIFKPRILKLRKAEFQEKIEILKQSGLFDEAWYLEQRPEAGPNPIQHYIWEGALEGLDPHPLFDTDWYLLMNRGARRSGENPLIHYLKTGWRRGCSPHPWFDATWYRERHSDVAKAKMEPLWHFLNRGWREEKAPHPDFELSWYRTTYRDDLEPDENPLLHFVRKGEGLGFKPNREGRKPEAIVAKGTPLSGATLHSDRLPTEADLLQQAAVEEELQRQANELETRTAVPESSLKQRFAEIALLTQQLEEKENQLNPMFAG